MITFSAHHPRPTLTVWFTFFTVLLSLSCSQSILIILHVAQSSKNLQPTIAAAALSFNENFINQTVLENLSRFAIKLHLNCGKKLFAERSQHWLFHTVISVILCELFRKITVDLLWYFFCLLLKNQNKSTE